MKCEHIQSAKIILNYVLIIHSLIREEGVGWWDLFFVCMVSRERRFDGGEKKKKKKKYSRASTNVTAL